MTTSLNSHDIFPPRRSGRDRSPCKVYLVGGGIASLSAAAFMIRDGDTPGADITILEQIDTIGGSLDGSGSAEDGYVLRGGRMLESKYLCTFELFASIPTLDESRTVTEEIFAWNDTMKTSSKSPFRHDSETKVLSALEPVSSLAARASRKSSIASPVCCSVPPVRQTSP